MYNPRFQTLLPKVLHPNRLWLCLLWAMVLLWGISVYAANTDSSATKKHFLFKHSVELGGTFNIGHTASFAIDHSTGTTSHNNILGTDDYSKNATLRVSHRLVLKDWLQAGVAYGADLYFNPNNHKVYIPLLGEVAFVLPLQSKVQPMLVQRLGYAFLAEGKNTSPVFTDNGVKGGATSETLLGIGIKTKGRVRPQLLLGYKMQHIRTQSTFDVSMYDPSLPNPIHITTHTISHLVYATVGITF